MPLSKGEMTAKEKLKFEFDFTKEFLGYKEDTRHDLRLRLSGVAARAGATGKQLAGYTTLERMYRGDQWDHDEPAGATQRTDNYLAVIVDNLSSLIFDDEPEINAPADDPTDDLQEIKCELKENLITKVWDDNGASVELDELAKVTSCYGDGFIKGPWVERVDKMGRLLPSDSKEGFWRIRFCHIENPGSIRPIFADVNFKTLVGFIHETRILPSQAERLYGKLARSRGIVLAKESGRAGESKTDIDTQIPMVNLFEYWNDEYMGLFVNEKLLDWYKHGWGFVPLEYIKNIHIPNHPYGKSDMEDSLDPQLLYNRTTCDLANLLKWLSTVNLWGKNLEGMQALVAGLSRIYSVPEDGELHVFEKPGDPYITNTFQQQRRNAIIDISGLSEVTLSGSQVSNSSGRALAMAFQGTIRKLNPRVKRFALALQNLNRNILRLYEIYFPKTKIIIEGKYNNRVFLPVTLLRNIVDTLNKLQSGVISLDTAQKEAGVRQPRLEQKLMRKNLTDPILGPQIARQPALLPRLSEGENQSGDQPMPGPGNKQSSTEGAVAANNQQASGAAPVPIVE